MQRIESISKLHLERNREVDCLEKLIDNAKLLVEGVNPVIVASALLEGRLLQKQRTENSLDYNAEKVKCIIADSQKIYNQLKNTNRELSSINKQASSISPLDSTELQALQSENVMKSKNLVQQLEGYTEQETPLVEKVEEIRRKMSSLTEQSRKIEAAIKARVNKKVERKIQIKKTRWLLMISTLGLIAYRLVVLGGWN